MQMKTLEVEVVRVKITLACTECKQRNYNMTKEKKNHPERLETKKYCKFCQYPYSAQGNKVITKYCDVKKGIVRLDYARERKICWQDRSEEKMVSGTSIGIQKDCLVTDRHTG